jgi:hypothetical protein
LVGWLLVLGGLAMIAASAQTAREDYERHQHNQALGQTPAGSSGWDWLMSSAVVAGAGLLLLVAGWIMVAVASSRVRLLRAGDAGRARVVEVVPTGRAVDQAPTLRITLLIDLPGQATYAATTRATVPAPMLGRVQPGAIVAVRVDPRNPQRVALDWAGANQAA